MNHRLAPVDIPLNPVPCRDIEKHFYTSLERLEIFH